MTEQVTKSTYNVVFEAIREPLITTAEFNSLVLPVNWEQKDLLINVKTTLISRGLIGNEMKKLALYAATVGVDFKGTTAITKPNSNILIGGSL